MPAQTTYRVTHETRYEYSDTIAIARQLAHLKPRVFAWQQVRSHRLDIDPAPGEGTEGVDYFGNAGVRFAGETPHDVLTVRARSVVEVADHAPCPVDDAPAWESALGMPGVWGPDLDLDIEQYRLASPMTPV